MKPGHWLLVGALGVGAAEVMACSSKFSSCTATRTCPPLPGAGSGGEAGETAADAGETSSVAGQGGAPAGGEGGAEVPEAGQGGGVGVGEAGSGNEPDLSCAACGGDTPQCKHDGNSSTCVACLSDADCGGATPVCNTATNACIARPSCVGLAATCGPSGNGDCCASSLVPGGTFLRSFDGVKNTNNTNPATVGTFRLDNFEITVGRFRKFLAVYSPNMIAEGAGKNPNNPKDNGWQTGWNAKLEGSSVTLSQALQCSSINGNFATAAAGQDNLPVNCISWYDAQAFCIWDGGRLPTEAEWNYAATGGSAQRVYAWGNTLPSASNNLAVFGCNYGGGGGDCTGLANIAPVGSMPAGNGKWGQSDLSGNLEELVQDITSVNYLIPCDNCANQVPDGQLGGGFNTNKAARGGTFRDDGDFVNTSFRSNAGETSHSIFTGARCARAP